MGLTREELWKLRLRDARSSIASKLTGKTYTPHSLETLLSESREDWRFPRTLHTDYFLDYLVKTKLLKKHLFTREEGTEVTSYSNEAILFAAPDTNDFDLALGLRERSFFSHLSAAYLHGLTNLVPRVFYTNREQAPKNVSKSKESDLQQQAVDRAFSKAARRTGFAFTDDRIRVVLLAGQFTERLEVLDTPSPDSEASYPATSLERTLIDCTVRPTQAGGIHEVLQMYEAARDRVSVRRMSKVLQQLGFIYPYRQAIGFMLERAGYSAKQQAQIEKPDFNIDFYLDYAMSESEFSPRWRLHYPKGF